MRHFAVVGSGPSGCYCAEALFRAAPDARVDVLERLPTPYGLVRSGVAPDHQPTKGVTRLLERVLAKPEAAFFGGVELQRDVTLDELRERYDAVVIATGAPLDRRLGVPGEDLPGVYASGRFVGWYNQHPDHADADLARVRSAVVIGSGNVALDVARLLAKSETEFAGSDLPPDVCAAFAGSGIARIAVIGRSAAAAMKFTEAELLEFGELERASVRLGANASLADRDGKAAAALRAVADDGADRKPVDIVFEFGLTPVAFEADGAGALGAVRFVSADGAEHVREAQLAVTCIGYESHGHGLPIAGGAIANDDGRVSDGVYVVGWAKRGPSGTIPTNRAETAAAGKPGGASLAALLHERGVDPVDIAAWRRIDASEIARAGADRARRKWRSHDELRAAARVAAFAAERTVSATHVASTGERA